MDKIIDGHVHLAETSVMPKQSDDPASFVLQMENSYQDELALMEKNKIDQTVVFGNPHKKVEVETTNRYIWEAYQKNKERFIPICRIDKKLKDNLKKGFKGAKVHLLYEEMITSDLKEYVKILEDMELPLILHALFKDKAKQVQQLLKYAPNLKIILAHMGRNEIFTMNGVIETITKLEKHEKVYFETSTVGDKRAVEEAVKLVGADRVIYGSDYPFNKIWLEENGRQYRSEDDMVIVKDANILESDKEKILYDNAKGIFK